MVVSLNVHPQARVKKRPWPALTLVGILGVPEKVVWEMAVRSAKAAAATGAKRRTVRIKSTFRRLTQAMPA
jgi:hypothetical protein